MSRLNKAALAIVLLALVPLQAQAHLSGVKVGDFWLGVLHPLTNLVDALAVLGLGLLAGQSGEAAGLRVAGTYAGLMALGGFVALHGVGGAWVGWINLASLFIVGGLVALSLGLPRWLLIAMATIFGLSHGMANGAEMTAGVNAWLLLPGLAVSGFFAAFYAMFIVIKLTPWWTKIGVRVIGSWIAAIGLLVIALNILKPGKI